uniref:Calpain-10 isoform X3 n=1 Tax=Callorhinus ursinus TaxID=34884 RepID=A0A3Q7QFA4_CALUR|nr:calpain-10 isoform X3 [Callorhinus ursinus]
MLVSLEMASLLSKTSQERPSLACKYTVSMETSAWSPVLGAPWLWPQRCLGSTESASLAWKEEICATPRLFADNPQEGQVKQGLLGDCWFLCACAALQKSRHLLDQVFPPGQPSWHDHTYRGSFTCRVWQFGRWVEVTIDDRLPCLAGRLCFSRCQREDVFWLPLLEKVYAKVYGSYEHLWAGQVADALVDLTGGLAERWSLRDLARASSQQDRPGGSEHRTCRRLLSLKDRCLISCSVLSPRAGARELGEFHAFIVSDLRELQGRAGQSILLLCIQNPWGRRCWQGPWREGCRKESSGWRRKSSSRSLTRSPLASRSRRPATCRASTQERRCATLRSCLGPGSRGSRQEAVGTTAAFPATPSSGCGSQNRARCLPLSCRDPGCAPQARQAGLGLRWGTGLPRGARPASWVEKRRVSLPRVLSTPPVAGTVCHAYDREVHLRCELTPGYYLAVPSTFLKDVPAQFLLRVFSSGRVSLSAIKSAAGSPAPGEALPAGEWETVQLRGSWRTGQTAGGSRNFASYPSNPCFPLSVPEGPGPRCVRVTLRQHCQDTQCHPIGFHVFQVPGTGGSQAAPGLLLQEPVLSCVPHRYAQEVSRLCHLSAGAYRIVPSTYLPDTEGAFTVTIATRIDRWGSRARGSSVYGVHRPVVAPAPTCPGGTAGEHVSLQGPGRRTRPFLELGASRATLFSLLQALHSQPGEAGAAPSGGLLHGS